MDSEDGQTFIKNLAFFVKTHERALANALYQNQRRQSRAGTESTSEGAASSTHLHEHASASSLTAVLPFLGLGARTVKPAKLTLTPHHLFYLLSRFQELGVSVGPMDIRLENIHSDAAPGNYVSFLNQSQRNRARNSDHDSIHSVSSIRSVMSSMSTLWTRLGLTGRSEAKTERIKLQVREDLTYLYSAFTKVPCLRLSPDHKAPLIAGYEEFPFDSAVPLNAFKNVTSLEICDIDFRQFYGWDRMADQLRSLTVKRGHLDDPADLLINIVLDDIDRRRRRSAKVPPSPMLPWSQPSPLLKHSELATSSSTAGSLVRPISVGASTAPVSSYKASPHNRQRSLSPRPSALRQGSTQALPTMSSFTLRRSSTSSDSTDMANTPRGSSSNLPNFGFFPINKWRFLRHLSLADNGLTNISALSMAPVASTLQFLDLSHNLITEIPDGLSSLVALRALDLSHCMLASIHSLTKHPLPAITTLNLRGNRLSSLAGIERLLSLERIDLRENKLTDPVEIARLTGLPNMVEIYINRNHFTRTHLDYRITIFNLFRKTPGYSTDVVLDGSGPTSSEKRFLVDRTLETAPPPVVANTEPEPFNDRAPAASTADLIVLHDLPSGVRPPAVPTRRRSQRTSQRRKKMSRRRVIEIAHEEEDGNAVTIPTNASVALHKKASRTDDSTYGGSVDASASKISLEHTSKSDGAADDITDAAEVETDRPKPSAPAADLSKPLPAVPQPPVDSELYKSRIESLRQDLGSAWLCALSHETWENQASPPLDVTQHAFVRPGVPSPPARSLSQGLVSTGGPLG